MGIDRRRIVISDPPHKLEKRVRILFFSAAVLSVVVTVGIVAVLLVDSVVFFKNVSLWDFMMGSEWAPTIKPYRYGVLPILSGTVTFTLTTALIALPVGLLTAVFLAEYAPPRLRAVLKPALEILAGIPTVVYGYFALVYVTPFLRNFFPDISTFNVLSASIVVAIMIIPTISSISEDAIRAVPDKLRYGAYGLGMTRFQTIRTVVLPSALSGITSSFILGISRVIGETMAVTIAAGRMPRIVNLLNLSDTFLKPIQTMTSAMVEVGLSDVSGDSPAYMSLYAVGFLLFLFTLALNLISQKIKKKFREKYQ
ncbi:phosphate ABC transporter permease subunit PstC [Spirochaetia bacterium 38H-sp]|uniref:Phosphate transport system permease protein n=1 Tax=Rarispira pelagica TaxID=3141764 RepID=A0ABU9UC68_9SPIR